METVSKEKKLVHASQNGVVGSARPDCSEYHQCSLCSARYLWKKSLLKHMRHKHAGTTGGQMPAEPELSLERAIVPTTTTRAFAEEQEPAVSPHHHSKYVVRALERPGDYRALRPKPTTWKEFADVYSAHAGPGDSILGDAVCRRAEEWERTRMRAGAAFPPEALLCGETMDSCLDLFFEQEFGRNISAQTVVLQMRDLRWAVAYHLCRGEVPVPDEVYYSVDAAVRETQRRTTLQLANTTVLTLLDPVPYLLLHEELAGLLRRVQIDHIDPFIATCAAKGIGQIRRKEDGLVSFGCRVLRPWLALAMRVWNVPCRVQVDQGLVAETSGGGLCVARLAPDPGRSLAYRRIIHHDKVGGSVEATALPLCRPLSLYLHFYLRFCRSDPEGRYVFQAPCGGRWARPSRDMKAFLREHSPEQGGGALVQLLENHRFVHELRRVGLAVFAARTGFDQQKLKEYGALMRHSFETMQRYYATFFQYQLARRAALSLEAVAGRPLVSDEEKSGPAEALLDPNPGPLDFTRPGLGSFLRQLWSRAGGPEVVVRFRDIGTQTGHAEEEEADVRAGLKRNRRRGEEEEEEGTRRPGETPGDCLRCSTSLCVFGPVAVRKSPQFGRYFLACFPCSAGSKAVSYFPLGTLPAAPSLTSRPRNYLDIEAYVRARTGRADFVLPPNNINNNKRWKTKRPKDTPAEEEEEEEEEGVQEK